VTSPADPWVDELVLRVVRRDLGRRLPGWRVDLWSDDASGSADLLLCTSGLDGARPRGTHPQAALTSWHALLVLAHEPAALAERVRFLQFMDWLPTDYVVVQGHGLSTASTEDLAAALAEPAGAMAHLPIAVVSSDRTDEGAAIVGALRRGHPDAVIHVLPPDLLLDDLVAVCSHASLVLAESDALLAAALLHQRAWVAVDGPAPHDGPFARSARRLASAADWSEAIRSASAVPPRELATELRVTAGAGLAAELEAVAAVARELAPDLSPSVTALLAENRALRTAHEATRAGQLRERAGMVGLVVAARAERDQVHLQLDDANEHIRLLDERWDLLLDTRLLRAKALAKRIAVRLHLTR
jgi:hypothetical protein